MNLNNKEIDIIKGFLIDEISPILLIIFGSALNGNFRPDSDIDIAFLSEKEYPDYKVFILSQRLAALLGRDIDLVNLRNVSTVFKARIIGNGEVIYTKDEKMMNELFIRILKEYALLNEERKPIIERINKEGRVYG
jgi:predicted nucleotidyltransferase